MQRMFVRVVAVGGLALMYGSSLATAEAVSSPIGELVDATKADSTIVHMIKSGHGGGHSSGYSSGPHASSPMAFGAAASMGSHHHHHHHHHGRVFVGSGFYPYYDYNDCWWSRRYHRWVCPYY